MQLKEEYGVDFKLKYRYLQPDNLQECAIFLKLSKWYPGTFELVSEKKYPNDYKLKLKIINSEL